MSDPLRQDIEVAIQQADAWRARRLLGELYQASPSLPIASYVIRQFERIDRVALIPQRVYILRSFTVEPIVPLLRAEAYLAGIEVILEIGDFNAFVQEIVAPDSRLYAFDPQIAILAAQTRDAAPWLWHQFATTPQPQVMQEVDRFCREWQNLMRTFRGRSAAHLVVHLLETPPWPTDGIVDAQSNMGQVATIREVNRRITDAAASLADVHLLDVDQLIAQFGRLNWYDDRMWATSRLPIRGEHLVQVARHWVRYLQPLSNQIAKVLVCDLDNTLWGGVIGEDGFEGIKLGDTYAGFAYQQLQEAILDLYHRGVVLAICSKNNHDEALDVLTNHPDMLLRPQHFASMQINWNDKAENLKRIAKEINVGLDSLVFIDDNPVERAWVRQALPEVTVLDLPKQPDGFASALRHCPRFERLSLSQEDRRRGAMYAEQRQRSELQEAAGSLEDYYRSLHMRIRIEEPSAATVPRVAQLTQRTNQLNMTTRRYTEAEIDRFLRDPSFVVAQVSVVDRFGDNGIVGVIIARAAGDDWWIDTLLLSCRVIGRTVESAMLAWLAQRARDAAAKRLVGEFLPTAKNAPAAKIYADNGFSLGESTTQRQIWQLDLQRTNLQIPEWFQRWENSQ